MLPLAPTPRLQNFWFDFIMDQCNDMICLHNAHILAVARPCDFDTGVHHVILWNTRITCECMPKQHIVFLECNALILYREMKLKMNLVMSCHTPLTKKKRN